METLPDLYPLTSLQIGDIQSHKSEVFLHFSPSAERLLILVDNRPWPQIKKQSRSTRLWHLMVTKYRVSPFINTRSLSRNSNHGGGLYLPPNPASERFRKLVYMVKAIRSLHKSLFPINISKALSGFIVFDLDWKDVHGIKYTNELQTDTSLALEMHSMKKWEFNGIDHAISCISLWFPRTESDVESLLQSLRKLSNLNIHHWISLVSSKRFLFRDSSLLETCAKRDSFFDAEELTDDRENMLENTVLNGSQRLESSYVDSEETIRPMDYKYNLLMLRFSDSILPFKLRQVLLSDPRLHRLLESGLPSWVIFLQSYPLFSHLYRPWIRRLAHNVYILISLSTFLIAFYDLYKKIPIMRSSVVMVFGPVFDWIEKWDMGSRVKYLGTMFFLQNIEKAIEWFVRFVRVVKPLMAVITKPFRRPFMEFMELFSPIAHACSEVGALLLSTMWVGIDYLHDLFSALVNSLLQPIELLYSHLLEAASTIYQAILSIWDFLQFLLQPVVFIGIHVYYTIRGIFIFLKRVCNLVEDVERSTWGELWSSMMEQASLALQFLGSGVVAFFIACNEYWLRIYSYICAIFDGSHQI